VHPLGVRISRVESAFPLDLGDGRIAHAVKPLGLREVNDVPELLGLSARPVLVVVGGASGMPDEAPDVWALFEDVLAPLTERVGAAVVDGGTDDGVMHLMGAARGSGAYTFPLVGVVVDDLADYGDGASEDAVALEPNHTHFVLVPGRDWGDEVPWVAEVAGAVAAGRGSATVLVNGGETSWMDVAHSIDAGRTVVVIGGSGRTADEIAMAAEDKTIVDSRARELLESGRIRTVVASDHDELTRTLGDLLEGG
jgi:SLOG in TRPM, prokaryote